MSSQYSESLGTGTVTLGGIQRHLPRAPPPSSACPQRLGWRCHVEAPSPFQLWSPRDNLTSSDCRSLQALPPNRDPVPTLPARRMNLRGGRRRIHRRASIGVATTSVPFVAAVRPTTQTSKTTRTAQFVTGTMLKSPLRKWIARWTMSLLVAAELPAALHAPLSLPCTIRSKPQAIATRVLVVCTCGRSCGPMHGLSVG